jgi:hypothetical protein
MAHATIPPCKSLFGQLSAQPRGVGGMADYDGNDDCVTYLTHPPVLLPVISALMLGEDNDRHNIRSAKQDDNYGASNIILPCPSS